MPMAAPDTSTLKKTVEEKELVSWVAPARPFKRRNRNFYVTVIVMAATIGFVLFLADGWLPVVLIISLVFLFYVMSTVPPENIEYKITNLGIKIANVNTPWEALGRFWFTKRMDSNLLVVETRTLPGRLELVIDPAKEKEIKDALSKELAYEEVPASNIDKAANWVSKRMPGNK